MSSKVSTKLIGKALRQGKIGFYSRRSVFTPAKRLQVDYMAQGTNVWVFAREQLEKYKCVNHGQGFPDWPSPQFVKKAAHESVDENHNQYCSPFGHPLLVEQLIIEYSKKFPHQKNLTNKNIQTHIGACGALENCCQAFLNPGDEVVTFEPYFDFYKYQTGHCHAEMKTVPVRLNVKNNSWEFDMKEFERSFNKKTKMFILNTPHNPTGMVFTKQQIEEIVQVLKKHPQVIVISDEVYEDLVYDNTKHYHIANFDNGKMFDRTITISSAAKKFSVTGWKIGWCVGPENLIEAAHFVARTQNWCQPTPLQVAVSKMLKHARDQPMEGFPNYWEWLQNMYQRKRDDILQVIVNGGLTPIKSQGTFFAVAECTEVLNKLIQKKVVKPELMKPESQGGKAEHNLDWQMMKWIAEHAKVTCLPMSAFTTEQYKEPWKLLRFSFCVSDEAFARSARGMKEMKSLLS